MDRRVPGPGGVNPVCVLGRLVYVFVFSSRRRHTIFKCDWSSDVCSSDLVKIQDQPLRVLILLLERPGEIVAREELRHRLWSADTYVDFEGSLNVILKKLRAAIDDDSENPRFIETVPRHGYRFIAPVSGGETTVIQAIRPNGAVPTAPQLKSEISVLHYDER